MIKFLQKNRRPTGENQYFVIGTGDPQSPGTSHTVFFKERIASCGEEFCLLGQKANGHPGLVWGWEIDTGASLEPPEPILSSTGSSDRSKYHAIHGCDWALLAY